MQALEGTSSPSTLGPALAPIISPQLLERWWQPLLEPLRACLPLGPRALPDGFPLHNDILG